jgi:Putative prokaryotic signal transducing protein
MATQPRPTHEEGEELVPVFDSEQESEAMVVQSLLESAGIEALITGFDAPQDVLPGVGGVVVRVAAERAAEARKLIEESKKTDSAALEEAQLGAEVPEMGGLSDE